jgi:hypothetical protein
MKAKEKDLKLNYLWLFYIYKYSLSLNQPCLKIELNLQLYDKSYIELQIENVIEYFFCHQDKKKFPFSRACFFISSIDSEFEWQNTEHDTEQTVKNSEIVKCVAGRNLWVVHRIFV